MLIHKSSPSFSAPTGLQPKAQAQGLRHPPASRRNPFREYLIRLSMNRTFEWGARPPSGASVGASPTDTGACNSTVFGEGAKHCGRGARAPQSERGSWH